MVIKVVRRIPSTEVKTHFGRIVQEVATTETPVIIQTRGEDRVIIIISNSLGAMPRTVYDKMHAYADVWATRGVRAWNEGWWEMPVVVGGLN